MQANPLRRANKKVSFVHLAKETFLRDAFLAERDAHCVRDAASPVMHAFGACKNASHHLSQRSGITYPLFPKRNISLHRNPVFEFFFRKQDFRF